jgi:hypothetical protein
MFLNFQNMLAVLSPTKKVKTIWQKKIAACKRIFCAGWSIILAKKQVFLRCSYFLKGIDQIIQTKSLKFADFAHPYCFLPKTAPTL